MTHGFTVDGTGRKMSKSLGNYMPPEASAMQYGGEILRPWCAATDYSGDLAIDDKILAREVDSYRRIRNTLRFLLANTSDFDSATDAVPQSELLEIDRWALARPEVHDHHVARHAARGRRVTGQRETIICHQTEMRPLLGQGERRTVA